MSETKPGDRVGAALSAGGGILKLLGYGTYDGRYPLPSGPLEGIPNPRITLDDGSIVWGCQCWWGEEGKFKEMASKYDKVELVDLDGNPKAQP